MKTKYIESKEYILIVKNKNKLAMPDIVGKKIDIKTVKSFPVTDFYQINA